LRHFHSVWGYIAIVANALAGLLCLLVWRVPRLRGRWVWVITITAQAMLMVQVVVGTILVASGQYTVVRFHMFYGFVAFITVGLAYQYRTYMRGKMELYYGLVGLFLMGVGIRAVLQVV
jgi:hypothetical protein